MDNREIQDLLRLLSKLEIAEFKLKTDDLTLNVRTKHYYEGAVATTTAVAAPAAALPAAPVQYPAPTPAAPAPAVAAAPAPAATSSDSASGDEANYLAIKSPMVGTFYRSSSPDKPAFVKVGDTIAAGDTVCIIEAMKLFNEVDSELSGKIVKVLVEDAHPVEYDQVLFLVDPKG